MSRTDFLCPFGSDFDRFLYASVGEDQNGYVVTVLSALARLDVDPWKEASELATMSQEAARARLALLLSRFRDVPALELDHGSIVKRLTLLLPDRALANTSKKLGSSAIQARSIPGVQNFAILLVLLILAQVLIFGGPGLGE